MRSGPKTLRRRDTSTPICSAGRAADRPPTARPRSGRGKPGARAPWPAPSAAFGPSDAQGRGRARPPPRTSQGPECARTHLHRCDAAAGSRCNAVRRAPVGRRSTPNDGHPKHQHCHPNAGYAPPGRRPDYPPTSACPGAEESLRPMKGTSRPFTRRMSLRSDIRGFGERSNECVKATVLSLVA